MSTRKKPAEAETSTTDETTETTPAAGEPTGPDATPATADSPEAPVANTPASPVPDEAVDGEAPVVLGADDEISESLYDTSGSADEYVTLTKDVVEEFYYPDTKRPSHRLLFTKGQVVRRAQIDALNANVEARRAVIAGE